MQTQSKKLVSLFILFLATYLVSAAQDLKTPIGYFNRITSVFEPIEKDTWDYTRAVAHNRSARKVESERKTLVASINSAIGSIKRLKDFEGDAALRDSALSYLDVSKAVIEQNYSKIMEMEDIAEQSYDAMEAYILAQQKANEIMQQSGENIDAAQKAFAQSHNIDLQEREDKVSRKLKQASRVYEHYNKVYLIFFKAYKQEAYLMDATKKGDVNAIEQNKNSLLKFATEGLESLKDIKSFDGDGSLKMACQQMLTFYKEEAEKKYQDIIDFQLKKDNFDKETKAMESRPAKERTKAVVDAYNKAVNEFNDAVKRVNQRNAELNNARSHLLNNWNSTADSFTKSHV